MKRVVLILALMVAAVAALAQNSIKVQVPNVVAADEQFNLSFIIEGENAPSDFSWPRKEDRHAGRIRRVRLCFRSDTQVSA